MLSIGSLTLAGILCTGIAASTAWAEEEKPTADLSVSALSKYVWRGFELSDDSIVLQPSMTVGYKGFAFNVWGNLDTDVKDDMGGPDENSSSWNETDLTLSYTRSFDPAECTLGYIYYGLEGEDSQEIFASVTLKTILSPTLAVYRDYDAFPGWYITLGISHSVPVTDKLSLDLGAKVGYYDVDDEETLADDDGDAYSGFHDGVISASMTFPVGEYFAVTPEIHYSFPLTSDAEDVIEGASFSGDDSEFLYGGVTVSMSF